jgi:hypothetical protein
LQKWKELIRSDFIITGSYLTPRILKFI